MAWCCRCRVSVLLALVLVLNRVRSTGALIARSPSASDAFLLNWCHTPNGAGWQMPSSVRA
jgi:hypothetical protein